MHSLLHCHWLNTKHSDHYDCTVFFPVMQSPENPWTQPCRNDRQEFEQQVSCSLSTITLRSHLSGTDASLTEMQSLEHSMLHNTLSCRTDCAAYCHCCKSLIVRVIAMVVLILASVQNHFQLSIHNSMFRTIHNGIPLNPVNALTVQCQKTVKCNLDQDLKSKIASFWL